MQEIAQHIYIETIYAGVTVGAINWPHGLILIDAPFRPEDTRSWRSALLNLGGGVDRLLVNLDAHLDRTLGVRAMDCTVVGHEKMAAILHDRPAAFKAQPNNTGAEWELYNNLGSVRWAPPEITFSDQLKVNWNGSPVMLEYRPGPASDAIWVSLPEQQVVFVGDAITLKQPPFLSGANLDAWINLLNMLLSPDYREWILVSSRGGLATFNDVRQQLTFLETVKQETEALAQAGATAEETARLVPGLISQFQAIPDLETLYMNRLRHGLKQYYARHYRPSEVQEEEE